MCDVIFILVHLTRIFLIRKLLLTKQIEYFIALSYSWLTNSVLFGIQLLLT